VTLLPIAAATIPAAIAWLAIAILLRSAWSTGLADHPNERSLHSTPRPRIGGIGIGLAVIPFAAALSTGPLTTIFAAALALALVSLADDLRSLPVAARLCAHGIAAAVAMAAIAGWPANAQAWGVWLVGALAIAWSANLYNFMDGSDGLAGGMAVIGFGACAIAAFQAGQPSLATLSLAIASASAGFLAHNFPPARVFMGDAGSIPLGFLAAAIGLLGIGVDAWTPAFPLLVFSAFAVDATVTLLRRLAAREAVWRAHRSHYYQRLVLSGWPPRRLAWSAWGLMASAAASALAARTAGAMLQCGIIFGWAVAYALLFLAIDRKRPRNIPTAP
jgi:UDP-N-acetylmuramyl pentapeptide phosphotransferase/UDP-N-acetylglucosamine-1-phosphate transferase